MCQALECTAGQSHSRIRGFTRRGGRRQPSFAQARPSPASRPGKASDHFPPIADYAFLSDCEVALIAPDGCGRVDVPAPPGFAEHLRRAARPLRGLVPLRAVERRGARPASLPAGHQRARDDVAHTDGLAHGPGQLVMGPRRHRRAPQRLPPGPGRRGRAGTLLRIATCFGGRVEMQVNCLPLFDYGRTRATWSYDGSGYGGVDGDVR